MARGLQAGGDGVEGYSSSVLQADADYLRAGKPCFGHKLSSLKVDEMQRAFSNHFDIVTAHVLMI